MSSTNKTSLGLNMWEASDKPVRQDFVNDNTIIDEKITNVDSKVDNLNATHVSYDSTGGNIISTNVQSVIKQLDNNFSLESGAKRFRVGYDVVNDKTYLQIFVGPQKLYQLTMGTTNIQYGKWEKGVWTTLWNK